MDSGCRGFNHRGQKTIQQRSFRHPDVGESLVSDSERDRCLRSAVQNGNLFLLPPKYLERLRVATDSVVRCLCCFLWVLCLPRVFSSTKLRHSMNSSKWNTPWTNFNYPLRIKRKWCEQMLRGRSLYSSQKYTKNLLLQSVKLWSPPLGKV